MIQKLLIANRGEIAIRVAATCAEMGIETVAVFPRDDAESLHRFKTDAAHELRGDGAAAYLDIPQLVNLACETGCDAIHPGYGFLSENAAFAQACASAGLTFVGPSPDTLRVFADKAQARAMAQRCGIPVLEGSQRAVDLEGALAFFDALPPGEAIMLKAIAGGGGRGMRIVRDRIDIAAALASCAQEASAAFGDDGVLVERFLPRARHVEVQVLGDGVDARHLGERECSLQRRNQKLVEFAPAPGLTAELREALTQAAVSLARSTGYLGLGTFEFLIDARHGQAAPGFYFMEANPRVQVEHTVTEAVTGVDLIRCQLQLAQGAQLRDLDLPPTFAPRGLALQARLNAEVLSPEGQVRPAVGQIGTFETPGGRGVRIETSGYSGYAINPRYDSLLAKLIVHIDEVSLSTLLRKTRRALRELRISGVQTNATMLERLLDRSEVAGGEIYTRFVDDHLADLLAAEPSTTLTAPLTKAAASPAGASAQDALQALPGVLVTAPMQGLIVEILVTLGERVMPGQVLARIEAMKMVHLVEAPTSGVVSAQAGGVGDVVDAEAALFVIEADARADGASDQASDEDPDQLRPELVEVGARRALGLDEARLEAVQKRHLLGQRTLRENIEDLIDPGTFVEYAPLAIAAQTRRRSLDDLARNTLGDGVVAGIGEVNGCEFGSGANQCVVVGYDYMVLAGTQGHHGHRKNDRMFELAERRRLPVILFSEGGGGRPGDIDVISVTGLGVPSFRYLARLSGLTPLVGVNTGRCFAGNAALLGCCDVIIATKNSSIGMGGPALIEAGGLGAYSAEEVGPVSVQAANGVIDLVAEDDAAAIALAKQYIGYFQGALTNWTAPDQRRLRTLLPPDRTRTYDIRRVLSTLVDDNSLLELRRGYAAGVITGLARVEGRPFGFIANNPMHLGGAIDGPGADKASRFLQLCDAHRLPVLSLCDTPGFMVGPDSEATATVRRFARLFVTAAGITTPLMAIVLRKAYGLGAMAMIGGQADVPDFLISWPAGEFGGMGLEGAIRLGLRKELAAIEDPEARDAYFLRMVDGAYAHGRALNAAAHAELDDVIDPVDSRRWIAQALRRHAAAPRPERVRTHIDTW